MNKIEPSPWRGVRVWEKFILVLLPSAAAVVFVLPFLDQFFLRRIARLPGARPIVTWLVNGYNAWLVGAVLLLVFGLFALWVRHRLMSDRNLWFGAGCPECKERELVRVSRIKRDRLYGLIGVPAYRYACRNCTWRGLRIAQREYTAERIAELEASLMRFDPDSPLPVKPHDAGDAPVESSTGLNDGDGNSGLFAAGDDEPESGDSPPAGVDDETEDDEPPKEANNHAGPEPIDAMEWLWRRSSES